MPFSKICLATAGFSSKNCSSLSLTTLSTIVRMSLLPSLDFVWPSNCGFSSLTEMTAVRPSRQSSPESVSSSFKIFLDLP